MNKYGRYLLFFSLFFGSVTLFSCSDDDEPTPPNPGFGLNYGDAYILNSGEWNENNSTLDYFNNETKELSENVFQKLNGKGLGDTANDLLIYGSKMYIAVNISGQIQITDLKGESLKTITPGNDGSSTAGPRHFTADGGKVYVSLYDGYVARIDTTSLEIEAKVKVGIGVEQICITDKKLYAAISTNPNPSNLVQEISLGDFKEAKDINVVANPVSIKADKNGMLYVLSWGDAADGYMNKLVKLNPQTGDTTNILTNGSIRMSQEGDHLYLISSVIENWMPVSTEFIKYNTVTGKFEDKPYVNADVNVKDAQCVDVNPISGDVYILSGSYVANGDLFIISKDGALLKTVALSGMNPVCTRFVKN